jgi:hypothetical protein
MSTESDRISLKDGSYQYLWVNCSIVSSFGLTKLFKTRQLPVDGQEKGFGIWTLRPAYSHYRLGLCSGWESIMVPLKQRDKREIRVDT